VIYEDRDYILILLNFGNGETSGIGSDHEDAW